MRAPDFEGAGNWSAWCVKLPPVGERYKPDADATVATWLLHCPGAHAFWSYWWIYLIHLRPIEGERKPAVIVVPGAGWEMTSFAQDPAVPPDPDDAEQTMAFLSPVDWQVQFGEVKTDREAERVALAVVNAIMSGKVSPDSDFRQFWKDTIPSTAAHYAAGGHPES